MEKTVAKMKIGDRLIFGSYTASKNEGGKNTPIVWLKASKNCDFITADIVDYMIFDAVEPDFRYGNADYSLSNIFSFLNSDFAEWFVPKHSQDKPPFFSINHHPGFLYYFEDYELASLTVTNGSLIRLPSISDVVDDTRFSLFKHKGVRAKASVDCAHYNFTDRTVYIPYWLRPEEGIEINKYTTVPIFGRSGKVESAYPAHKVGVRPVCTIKPSLSVKSVYDESYCIVPFETENGACTDDELIDLLEVVVNL